MLLSHRIKLFLLYYLVLWAGLGAMVWYNVLGPQAIQFQQSLILAIPSLANSHAQSLSLMFSLGAVFGVALLPTIFLLIFKNRSALVLTVFGAVAILVGAGTVFTNYALVPPFLYLMVGYGSGVLVAVFLKMIYSSSEKDFLRAAFSQFVSEDMLRELLRDPGKLRLTGKEYSVTIMFVDIRGFTSYSEKKTPAIVVARLNELLEIVTSIIVKHDGTVDKYIGDAVMAMWGAPTADKKQASKAVTAALEIKQKIEAETDFTVGIGINYGKAIVGNIGSTKRFDYTAIGDMVNSASRIEGLTKSLGASIVVSKAVMEKTTDEKSSFEFESLGQVLVKGKNQKLSVFGVK